MTENKVNLDDWTDFAGEYLKVDLVKEFPLIVVPIDVEAQVRDGKTELSIVFEYSGKTWKLGLNKTNQNVIRGAGIAPKDIVGCKLTFEKTKARNPQTNSMVDSFVLTKAERTN